MEKIDYESKVKHYCGSSIALFVGKYFKPNQKILDIGCGVGNLGEFLKKKFNSVIYGIDISKTAINEAKKKLDFVKRLDIEKEDPNFKPCFFDVIVMTDVLEHLVNPKEILLKYKKYLKDNGYFVLVVPNIASIKIRLHLLSGKFDYANSGILDSSHLRFFTKKSIAKMIHNSNLNIILWDYIPDYFLQSVIGIRLVMFFNNLITKIRPTMFAKQFIIICKK